jgi:hypothetical protein
VVGIVTAGGVAAALATGAVGVATASVADTVFADDAVLSADREGVAATAGTFARAFRALSFWAFSFWAFSCSALARAAARACASAVAGPTVGASVDGATGSLGAGFEGSMRLASADGESIGVVGVDSDAPAESGTRRRRTMTVG